MVFSYGFYAGLFAFLESWFDIYIYIYIYIYIHTQFIFIFFNNKKSKNEMKQ